MKQNTKEITRLSRKDTMAVAVMLFGMFFGAGNLIFPVYLGQQAGGNTWSAIAGFLVTGVGIPLLAIAALAASRSDGLQELASHVSKHYGIIFTTALYLTIGPFFAIPRCASTSFSVGILPIIRNTESAQLVQWIFSLLFFAAVLWFSLRPGKILTWIGKVLTPAFLVFLGILLITALIDPIGDMSLIEAQKAYQSNAFFQGFLDGYNTMDALAGLAFGIVVVDVIHDLGVQNESATAICTLKSGAFSCLLMAVIYVMLAIIGAQSRAVYPLSADGGEALYIIASHYFHTVGSVILAVIVTMACLKTAIGLVTSCGETFEKMCGGKIKYPIWAIAFCVISFLIANLGLSSIIAYSLPVLMLLYPLAMTLIFLALSGKFFDHDRIVYISVTVMTLIAGIFDFLNALPSNIKDMYWIRQLLMIGEKLPFFSIGLGWVCPALIGFLVGMILHFMKPASSEKAQGIK